MKRHPALVALSSDHHHGLVQARRLLKASDTSETPGTDAGNTADAAQAAGKELERAAADFIAFWLKDTSRHFREEEEVLLPAFARHGDPSEAPIARMLVEHVRIRQLVDDLQAQMAAPASSPSPATMCAIGEMLRAHIRYEEDVVFPLIERSMPEEALNQLPAKLSAFARGYSV